jgi:hypothetical protein
VEGPNELLGEEADTMEPRGVVLGVIVVG